MSGKAMARVWWVSAGIIGLGMALGVLLPDGFGGGPIPAGTQAQPPREAPATPTARAPSVPPVPASEPPWGRVGPPEPAPRQDHPPAPLLGLEAAMAIRAAERAALPDPHPVIGWPRDRCLAVLDADARIRSAVTAASGSVDWMCDDATYAAVLAARRAAILQVIDPTDLRDALASRGSWSGPIPADGGLLALLAEIAGE